MRQRLRICGLGIVFVLFYSLPGFSQSLEGKVVEHHLDNGLTLLVYERHQAPIVACEIYVKIGSAHDALGQTGIAHMTEHIAFKGTKTIGTTNYEAEQKVLQRVDDLWRSISQEYDKGEAADQEHLKQQSLL